MRFYHADKSSSAVSESLISTAQVLQVEGRLLGDTVIPELALIVADGRDTGHGGDEHGCPHKCYAPASPIRARFDSRAFKFKKSYAPTKQTCQGHMQSMLTEMGRLTSEARSERARQLEVLVFV